MARNCIEEKEKDGRIVTVRCPHLTPSRHIACGILNKKGLIPAKVGPQKYCPIEGGYGANVEFNYPVLAKYESSTAWAKIMEARKNDGRI